MTVSSVMLKANLKVCDWLLGLCLELLDKGCIMNEIEGLVCS